MEGQESSQESGVGTSVGIQTFPALKNHTWLTSPMKNLMPVPVCEESKEEEQGDGTVELAFLFMGANVKGLSNSRRLMGT